MSRHSPSWSEEATRLASPVYESIIGLPFVRALADGTLPDDKFKFYLSQDALYLRAYARTLAHAASRLPDSGMCRAFLDFATVGIEVERDLHRAWLADDALSDDDMSPACMLYTSWHLSHAYDPVEVEAAGLLPCFTIYAAVGTHIAASATTDNPYRRWIDTYSDPAFISSCRKAVEICDRLAEDAAPKIRQDMSRAFLTASRMEWLFWDSAWDKRKWKI